MRERLGHRPHLQAADPSWAHCMQRSFTAYLPHVARPVHEWMRKQVTDTFTSQKLPDRTEEGWHCCTHPLKGTHYWDDPAHRMSSSADVSTLKCCPWCGASHND
jgi:hypothetical protein